MEMIRKSFKAWAEQTCISFKEVSPNVIKAPGIIVLDGNG